MDDVNPAPGPTQSALTWVQAILLSLVVGLLFGRVLDYNFVNYDDPAYVTENQSVLSGPTVSSLIWALTGVGKTNLWHPLTWISLTLDAGIFGADSPGAFHAVNVLMHIGSTLFLFLILRLWTPEPKWLPWVCVLVWAVHPQRVESVVWISQRKDVLSGLFFFASWWCWESWRQAKEVKTGAYWMSILAFTLAAMAKPSVVPLPLILAIAEWGRPRSSRLQFVELAKRLGPYFCISLAVVVLTLHFQAVGGLADLSETLPLSRRLALIPVSMAWYLEQTLFPNPGKLWNYPPMPNWPELARAFGVLAVAGCALLWAARREPRVLFLAAAMFLLWLPVSGLVPVSFYFVADRYSYLPQALLVLAVALSLRTCCSGHGTQWAGLKLASVLFVVLTAMAMTWQRTSHWKSSETRFRHEMSINPRSLLAPIHLGLVLEKKGDSDEALRLYQRALEIDSESGLAATNAGRLLLDLERKDEALAMLRRAIDCKRLHEETSFALLAELTAMHGRDAVGAREVLLAGVRRFPSSFVLCRELGALHLSVLRQAREAEKWFAKALEISPKDGQALQGRGVALAECGRFPEAREVLERAFKLDPKSTGLRDLIEKLPPIR